MKVSINNWRLRVTKDDRERHHFSHRETQVIKSQIQVWRTLEIIQHDLFEATINVYSQQ